MLLPTAVRYAAALGAVAVALLARLSLDPVLGVKLPYITLFPSIMVASWLGGFWPGVVATVVSAIAAELLWIEPRFSWGIADKGEVIGVILFCAVGGAISALNEAWRRGTIAVLESEHRLRHAQRDAEIASEQLRAGLEAGRMGTWLFTVGTGLVKWSAGLEALHGFSPGTFPGTFEAFQAEIHPDDRPRVLGAITTALNHRSDHHVEYRIVRRDGTVRWVEGRGKVFCDRQGQPEQMAGVCLDVTERKQLEDQRALVLSREQAARADLERAGRMKDEFLATLSHELRTPLNAVLGYAHMLQAGTLPQDRVAHAIEVIERNAAAQMRLIDSLLDVSRVMAGKFELQFEPVQLEAVVEAAVDAFRPQAQRSGIALEIVAPLSPVRVIADSGRLQQVLWNLISNALKFTPSGGQVGVHVTQTDSEVRIQVRDTGHGISGDLLPHVFDRFWQADSSTRPARAGLGLGLTLVREIVQAHGGAVVAESDGDGRGSAFTVTLPVPAAAVRTGLGLHPTG